MSLFDCKECVPPDLTDINETDSLNRTPLHLAAVKGHAPCIDRLVALGAAVDAKDKYDQTTLDLAAEYGHADCIDRLVALGAAVDAKHKYGKTPLHWAAVKGHAACIDRLVALGAAVDAKDKYDQTTLDLAAEYGHADCIDRLVALGAAVDAKHKYGKTPLHWAAVKGHAACIDRLVALGAAVDAKDKYDQTTLDLAAEYGHADCIDRLVALGAAVDAKDKNDKTPLHWAAQYGHADCIDRLVALGAAVDAKSKDGWTPLHYAAWGGHADCIDRLVALGATVDAKDKYGKTPLHVAANEGHADCIDRLAAAGASLHGFKLSLVQKMSILRARVSRCKEDGPIVLKENIARELLVVRDPKDPSVFAKCVDALPAVAETLETVRVLSVGVPELDAPDEVLSILFDALVTAFRDGHKQCTLDLRMNSRITRLPAVYVQECLLPNAVESKDLGPHVMSVLLDECKRLQDPPYKVVENGLDTWLREFKEDSSSTLTTMRLCMIGHGGAGKTTLRRILPALNTLDLSSTSACKKAAAHVSRVTCPLKEWDTKHVVEWFGELMLDTQFKKDIIRRAWGTKFLSSSADQLKGRHLVAFGTPNPPEGEKEEYRIDTEFFVKFLAGISNEEQRNVLKRSVRSLVKHNYGYTVSLHAHDEWRFTEQVGFQAVRSKECQFRMQDFAGQSEFWVTNVNFVPTRATMYVLCVKVDKKAMNGNQIVQSAVAQLATQLRYWLHLLKCDRYALVPLFVAVTHMDELRNNLSRTHEPLVNFARALIDLMRELQIEYKDYFVLLDFDVATAGETKDTAVMDQLHAHHVHLVSSTRRNQDVYDVAELKSLLELAKALRVYGAQAMSRVSVPKSWLLAQQWVRAQWVPEGGETANILYLDYDASAKPNFVTMLAKEMQPRTLMTSLFEFFTGPDDMTKLTKELKIRAASSDFEVTRAAEIRSATASVRFAQNYLESTGDILGYTCFDGARTIMLNPHLWLSENCSFVFHDMQDDDQMFNDTGLCSETKVKETLRALCKKGGEQPETLIDWFLDIGMCKRDKANNDQLFFPLKVRRDETKSDEAGKRWASFAGKGTKEFRENLTTQRVWGRRMWCTEDGNTTEKQLSLMLFSRLVTKLYTHLERSTEFTLEAFTSCCLLTAEDMAVLVRANHGSDGPLLVKSIDVVLLDGSFRPAAPQPSTEGVELCSEICTLMSDCVAGLRDADAPQLQLHQAALCRHCLCNYGFERKVAASKWQTWTLSTDEHLILSSPPEFPHLCELCHSEFKSEEHLLSGLPSDAELSSRPAIEARLRQLESKVDDNANRLQSLETFKDAFRGDLAALDVGVEQLQQHYASLASRVDGIVNDLKTARTELPGPDALSSAELFQEVKGDPKQLHERAQQYYVCVYKQLTNLYLAAKVVSSGLVDTDHSGSLAAFGTVVGWVADAFDMLVEGLGSVVGVFGTAAEELDKMRMNSLVSQLTWMATDAQDMAQVARGVALAMTRAYLTAEQLPRLDLAGVEDSSLVKFYRKKYCNASLPHTPVAMVAADDVNALLSSLDDSFLSGAVESKIFRNVRDAVWETYDEKKKKPLQKWLDSLHKKGQVERANFKAFQELKKRDTMGNPEAVVLNVKCISTILLSRKKWHATQFPKVEFKWQHPDSSDICRLCCLPFSLLERAHHCYGCGILFCDARKCKGGKHKVRFWLEPCHPQAASFPSDKTKKYEKRAICANCKDHKDERPWIQWD